MMNITYRYRGALRPYGCLGQSSQVSLAFSKFVDDTLTDQFNTYGVITEFGTVRFVMPLLNVATGITRRC